MNELTSDQEAGVIMSAGDATIRRPQLRMPGPDRHQPGSRPPPSAPHARSSTSRDGFSAHTGRGWLSKTRRPTDGADHSAPSEEHEQGHGFSTLTFRILAVNLLALLVFVGGVMFLDQYRKQLIDRELATLSTEARVFAAMVSEGAVVDEDGSGLLLSPRLGRQMVHRLTETTKTRSRLLDADGQLIADSHLLSGGLGVVEIEELPPLDPNAPASPGFGRKSASWIDYLFSTIDPVTDIDNRPSDEAITNAASINVHRALSGDVSATAWLSDDFGMQFTAAAPVQQLKKVLGAVLLIRDGQGVTLAMTEVRRSILYISMIAFSITVLLSLYLASTIERPLRRLARAADRVRRSPGRTAQIPDFTERKDEIGDLSLALREMTESLWLRLDAIESFAADVSHELKNPLTSLRSAVETAARLSDPEQQRKLMGIIQDDVRRLDRLITDISNASRLDAELSRTSAEPVDIAEMLEMLADVHRNTTLSNQEGAPELVLSLPDHSRLLVPGMESRLVQVFQNLIGNAISFSPPGGHIWLTARRKSRHVQITIDDEGPGIPEGKLTAIFNRFYSERPKSEKFGTHSGLGLSISQQIIAAHRGTIKAQNRHDGTRVIGARFVVTLPQGMADGSEG